MNSFPENVNCVRLNATLRSRAMTPPVANFMADCCYLCGVVTSTVDYIPPRGFFSVPPVNIIRIPACEACSQSVSLGEEYMRTTLAAQGYGNSLVAREVWEGAVQRAFIHRPQGLGARLVQALTTLVIRTPTGVIAGYLPGIKVDSAQARRVLRKISRGLYFQDCGKRLNDDELILFRDEDARMNFEMITRGWPEVDMGEGFRYRSKYSIEGGLIWFEFYRTNWWLAMTGDIARKYPKR